jgi:hypothetical protein
VHVEAQCREQPGLRMCPSSVRVTRLTSEQDLRDALLHFVAPLIASNVRRARSHMCVSCHRRP